MLHAMLSVICETRPVVHPVTRLWLTNLLDDFSGSDAPLRSSSLLG
jgi:hypothetical protein